MLLHCNQLDEHFSSEKWRARVASAAPAQEKTNVGSMKLETSIANRYNSVKVNLVQVAQSFNWTTESIQAILPANENSYVDSLTCSR
jgi:hypothetical protein